MIKMDNFQYFSIKYVVEAILIHIQNIRFYGELMVIKVKTLVFLVNFMSTETFA